MTDRPFPITYQLVSDLKDPPKFITYLGRYIPEKVKGKATGEMILEMLPVYFHGPGREVAEDKAMRFWDDETAKKQAAVERGRKLGSRART